MAERRPAYCTLCRSRCGCTVVVEDGRLTSVEPLAGHPTGGALCAKGRAAPELVASPRRLTRPLKRTKPRDADDAGWVEIGWDEALGEIAGRLAAIRDRYGPEAVAFAVTTPSGTPMVDSFEWVERFVRLFGSPNLIYAIEICGWHKDYAHALTFGRGIGMPDYDRADTIVLWGHNPVRTWLAQASRIAAARERGARVIVVDPKPNGSGQQCDLWLRIRPGRDGILAMGAIRHLIETDSFDRDFVTRWTNAPMLVRPDTGAFLRASEVWPEASAHDGFVVVDDDGRLRAYDTAQPLDSADDVALAASALVPTRDGPLRCRTAFRLLAEEAARYEPEFVAEATSLEPDAINRFNAAFAGSPKLAYHAWTGVGQHSNATATERAIATLYALTGACDRPGGNLWPVPPPTRSLNDYDLLAPAQQAKALGLDELPLGPPSRGWITARDFRRAALEGEPYRVRALVGFGANLVVSQGHSSANRAALQTLDFQVHVDMFLNPTAESADIVLPASMPWERDALRIGFEITQDAAETVQFRPKMIEPPGACRADYEIVADLAARLGFADRFFGGDIEAGWNHQLAPLGTTVEALRRHPAGLRFSQPFGVRKFAAMRADGTVPGFATPTRRVEIYSERMRRHGYDALPRFAAPEERAPASSAQPHRLPLTLTTAKSGWFIHSSYRHIASLRRKSPEPAVEIHPELAEARGLAEDDWAIVETQDGTVRMRVRLNGALDPAVVIAEFGWWEDCPPLGLAGFPPTGARSSNINDILGDDRRDPVSGSVPLRAVPCNLHAAEAGVRSWRGKRLFRIAARRPESEDVIALDLVPADGKPLPPFRPGQHVVASLPGDELSRSYSLTGPSGSDRLSIAVRRDADAPARSLSRRLHALRDGDAIEIERPQGAFTPPLQGARPVVLLAAGVGITPFVAYLEDLASCRSAAHVVLLHVCRDGAHHPFGRRIRALARRIPTLTTTIFYSRPGPTDRPGIDFDVTGRLDPARIAPLIAARPLAYVCGSPDFTTTTAERLAALGLPRFDIFAEAFVSPPEVPAELAPCTIRIAGTELRFEWTPQSGTILDAALRAGVALPAGCRAGQCESCLVRVAAGSVAHLDGDCRDGCLTCQAIPLSDLVLAPL